MPVNPNRSRRIRDHSRNRGISYLKALRELDADGNNPAVINLNGLTEPLASALPAWEVRTWLQPAGGKLQLSFSLVPRTTDVRQAILPDAMLALPGVMETFLRRLREDGEARAKAGTEILEKLLGIAQEGYVPESLSDAELVQNWLNNYAWEDDSLWNAAAATERWTENGYQSVAGWLTEAFHLVCPSLRGPLPGAEFSVLTELPPDNSQLARDIHSRTASLLKAQDGLPLEESGLDSRMFDDLVERTHPGWKALATALTGDHRRAWINFERVRQEQETREQEQEQQDRQLAVVMQCLALSLLTQGIDAIPKDPAQIEAAFNKAWKAWPHAQEFPELDTGNPGALITRGLKTPHIRRGFLAGWSVGAQATPYLTEDGQFRGLKESFYSFWIHTRSRVDQESWTELGRFFVAGFPPPALGVGGTGPA